jgi:hypothetical protein
MLVRRAFLETFQGEPAAYAAELPDGRAKSGRFCIHCGTRLWGEPKNNALVVVQPGTLEQPCDLQPVAHQWTRSAQPWFVFPQGVIKFETQPEDPAEMVALWKQKHGR